MIVDHNQALQAVTQKLTEACENTEKVYFSGRQAEYDAFWDRYQNNGERFNYQYGAFGGIGWNDETFKPKYPLKSVHVYGMFQGCYITEIKDIDFSGAKSFNHVFAYSEVKKIGLIEIPLTTTMVTTFQGCTKLHTIEKIVISANSTFNNTFQNCSALENITFEGEIGNDINFQWSTKLTKASIISIINHLSDTASEKTLQLSGVAVDGAFAWEDFNDSSIIHPGRTNGFWMELEDSKPNWNITLI